MNNNKTWYDFFIEISKNIHPSILFRWEMENGAVFHMLLPSIGEIQKDTFSSEIEFPYNYDEINKIIVEYNLAGIECDGLVLNELYNIVERHQLLSYKKENGRISISLIDC